MFERFHYKNVRLRLAGLDQSGAWRAKLRPATATLLMHLCMVGGWAVMLPAWGWTKASAEQVALPFRLNVPSQPNSLDPRRLSQGQMVHIHFNVFKGLYRVVGLDQLEPDLAERCQWSKSKSAKFENVLNCHLKDSAQWSSGKPILASEVVEAYRSHFSESARSIWTEQFKAIEGFDKALSLSNGSHLKIRAIGAKKIEFEFKEPDAEFLYRLAHPSLYIFDPKMPYDSKNFSTDRYTGSFQVVAWASNRIQVSRVAAPNERVEFILVDDDETALSLFRSGELDLLRRVPTHQLTALRNQPGLRFFPVLRGDYVGFGPALAESPLLRKALALSLNYEELNKLYESRGRPGCPSQERTWFESPADSSSSRDELTRLCVQFNREEAKKALSQSRLGKEPWWTSDPSARLTLSYSIAGGDDIQKGMEWMQQQWKKNLGLSVELRGQETAVMTAQLRSSPPPIFRRGVAPMRPTCLGTIEVFHSKSRDNFIGKKDSKLDQWLDRLSALAANSRAPNVRDNAVRYAHEDEPGSHRELCRKSLEQLILGHRMIPLGQIHFVLLGNPSWTGWTLNGLGQLELTQLRRGLN